MPRRAATATAAAVKETKPLQEYARKRDFKKTSEPGPILRQAQETVDPRQRPLTFVIQKHSATRLHYDFRLELGGVLVSWAVPKGPSLDPGEKRLAVHVEDHPLDYGGYEGVIPKGEYGAGPVIVWDRGTWWPEEEPGQLIEDRERAEQAAREGLASGKLSIQLAGNKLHGSWALVKLQKTEKDWLLIKHRDEYAVPGSGAQVLERERSVISGTTVEELRTGLRPARGPGDLPGAVEAPFPKTIEPMLATLASGPFASPAWVFEPKLDGIRAIAMVRDGSARLNTRRGNDATRQYPVLADELGAMGAGELDLVLDGEIVTLDEQGRPSFQKLQERMNLQRPSDIRRMEETVPVLYYVFDLLYENGYSLLGVPQEQRHARLEAVMPYSERIRTVQQLGDDGEAAYEAVVAHGLEGLIAKRADSRYEPGRRSRYWLKIKATNQEEFVICGYTKGQGNREKTFGALLIGYYNEAGKLAFAGNVGTGFDDKKLAELKAELDERRVPKHPFAETPDAKDAFWVKPELVAEVKFAEWTREGRLRAPVFMRLRTDKPAEDVRRVPIVSVQAALAQPAVGSARPTPGRGDLAPTNKEDRAAARQAVKDALAQLENPRKEFSLECEGHRIPVTNMEKELWPPFEDHPPVTKRDLLRYLARVSPYILPHLKDRPLTLVRYPNGIYGEKFYQRHWEHPRPKFVEAFKIWSDHNVGDTEHMVCNNLATLLWLGQVADLEIHSWYSRINPEPDGHHLSMQISGGPDIVDASVANYPDFMVFDLDPYIYSGKEAKGAEPELNRAAFERARDVAIWLKEFLDQLSLTAFVKTTGKTGLHVFVPILRQWDYDETRAMCEALGRLLLQAHPKDITMDWAVKKRTGKIFFDHNQNVRSKTLASIFSTRASPEAGVSMPLSWNDLGKVYPTDFTVFTVPALLEERGDPWANILDAKADLTPLLTRSETAQT